MKIETSQKMHSSTRIFKTPLGLRKTLTAVLAALGLASSALASQEIDADSLRVTKTRQIELIQLVRQDCGSCHGLTLRGGLGAPLLPEALKDKAPEYLKAAILHGLAPTAMPPWKRFLSEADTAWIVVNLKKGFPGGD